MQDTIHFEKYGAETDGEYSLVRITVKPGGGTPTHYHRSYAETFRPVSGILGLMLNGREIKIGPGEEAHVPTGSLHRFFNPTSAVPGGMASLDGKEHRYSQDSLEKGDIVFVGEVRPAHEGFEKGLYIIYGLANDGLSDEKGLPKSWVHLCLCAALSDMYFPGWFDRIGSIFVNAVAAYARWSGEEEKLLKKYWYFEDEN